MRTSFNSLRVQSALAVISLLTMGCPSTAPNDTESFRTDARLSGDTGSAVDTGVVVDTGRAVDTGPAVDTGVVTDTGVVADTGLNSDAGMTSPTIASAFRGASRAECVCAALPQYATADICASVDFGAAAGDVCYEMAAATAGGAAQTWLNCNRDANVAFATCLSASGACDASDPCYSARTSAIAACGAEPNMDAYVEALDICISESVVGEGADNCSDTATASMGVGMGVFTGTTVGAGDHRFGMCVKGISGADASHRWTAPAAGDYRFDTAGSDFDTVLFALDGCGVEATELACSDDNIGESNLSAFTLTLTAGETVQIVVDGFEPSAAGSYRINVTAL